MGLRLEAVKAEDSGQDQSGKSMVSLTPGAEVKVP
jgi:hypothetical protein